MINYEGYLKNIKNGKTAITIKEIKDGYFSAYTERELLQRINSNAILIDGKDIEYKIFIENAFNKKYIGPKNRKILYMGKVGKRMNDMINAILLDSYKTNIINYNLTLDSDRFNHINRKHGNKLIEINRGQINIEKEDFYKLPLILSSSTIIDFSGIIENNIVVRFIKNSINGTYRIYELISDRKHNLSVGTIYKIAK